jgi:glycerophosphoryl diester phosphodiesterase
MTTQRNHSYIYAHRGATKEAAHNTRLAFNNALKQKAEGIETDVQLTKDKVPILYHNQLMEQLGYPNNHLCDFTFAQLEQINFSSYYHSVKAEGPITLKEFINSYRDKCRLIIEIKHRDWEETSSAQIIIQQCLEIIGETQNNDIVISSFTIECLEYAHQLGARIPLIYNIRDTHNFFNIKNILARYSFLNGVCIPIHTLDIALMHFLRNANKLILTYGYNTHRDINKALDLKVDILIIDDVETALKKRAK